MTDKINKQKMVTRDALSYVAEISKDRSIFATPSKVSQIEDVSNISITVSDDLEKSQQVEELTKLR